MTYSVFVDTNVLLSGLFFDGNERRLLEKGLRGSLVLVLSYDVLREAEDVIEEKFRSSEHLEQALILLAALRSQARLVSPGVVEENIGRANGAVADRSDVPILAGAMGGNVDMLVTGDKALREADRDVSFEICSPRRVLKRVEAT